MNVNIVHVPPPPPPPPPHGGIGIVSRENVDTRLYAQNPADGSIREYLIPNLFNVAGVVRREGVLVPAGQAQVGTPIAATIRGNFQEIHVFFVSNTGTLSEWFWRGTAWNPAGANRVNVRNFQVAAGSRVLYALQDIAENTIRVGFFSAVNNTLVEAIKQGDNWLDNPFPLPNP